MDVDGRHEPAPLQVFASCVSLAQVAVPHAVPEA